MKIFLHFLSTKYKQRLLHVYFHVKPHIIPRKAVPTRGQWSIPLFEGRCGACYESNHVMKYLSVIYYNKIQKSARFIIFSLSSLLAVSYLIVVGLVRNAFGRLHYFLLIPCTLFSYFCAHSVLFICGISPNYIEISTKNVKDIFDVGHFDFVASTLSMMFQGT